MFEQARHTNILTLGGTCRVQIFFQTARSVTALECSACTLSLSFKATWYADLTVNIFAEFSFHSSLSREVVIGRGIARFPFLLDEQRDQISSPYPIALLHYQSNHSQAIVAGLHLRTQVYVVATDGLKLKYSFHSPPSNC